MYGGGGGKGEGGKGRLSEWSVRGLGLGRNFGGLEKGLCGYWKKSLWCGGWWGGVVGGVGGGGWGRDDFLSS